MTTRSAAKMKDAELGDNLAELKPISCAGIVSFRRPTMSRRLVKGDFCNLLRGENESCSEISTQSIKADRHPIKNSKMYPLIVAQVKSLDSPRNTVFKCSFGSGIFEKFNKGSLKNFTLP